MRQANIEGAMSRRRVRTPGKHIVLVVCGCLVAVAVAASLLDRAPNAAPAAEPARQSVKAGRLELIPLDEFLVDLAPDDTGRKAYLKLVADVAIDAGDRAAATLVEERRAEIAERLTFLLRSLRPEDFEGSDGMTRVKDEMRRRVDAAIAPAMAEDVIISHLVIQ